MRAFTAVDIRDREILLELERLQSELDFGFSKVPPEKMHITLQFFQDIGDEDVEEVIQGLKDVEMNPFSLEIKGVGVFPSKDYVRVVWAGVESEQIYRLKEQVSRHDVEADNNHDFHPHVTLSRVDSISRRDKKEFRRKLERFENREIGMIEVDELKLFESVRTGQGTDYRELEVVEL